MRRAATAAGLAAALALAGCVSPSRTDDDYRHKAANTAEAVASAVGTARLAAVALRDGRVFGPYATRLIAEAEEDALAAQQAFDSVQPPSAAADTVHDTVDEAVRRALDLLRTARVAVRRGDFATVVAQAAGLEDAADELDRVAEETG
jgi:hypothetical protein